MSKIRKIILSIFSLAQLHLVAISNPNVHEVAVHRVGQVQVKHFPILNGSNSKTLIINNLSGDNNGHFQNYVYLEWMKPSQMMGKREKQR